ncbi:MAG TPA: S-methyl-5'-thioadenosine phosphorylase [Thermomicrobiales bacterium]|nr:S-methyl-5'-thioadenosine phosphorylase [Thermomicrobiales bacterium]
MRQRQPALGIIGGSGLYGLSSLTNVETVEVETPWGTPSEAIRIGEIAGQTVAFLSRHGAGHRISPTEIPYAANVCAMKMLGVSRLVSISAVGSLREDCPPRSFVVPDGTIDRTLTRQRTFFDNGIVAHVSIADPFCPTLSALLASVAETGGLPVHRGGTYIAIEGPQFSTRAESALFRSWGASVIGMTAMPEARLAREAELCYSCLAMVTDYDVWHEEDGPVTVDAVLANLFAMTDAVQTIVTTLAGEALPDCDAGCSDALSNAIATSPDAIDAATRARLAPIAGRYLDAESAG